MNSQLIKVFEVIERVVVGGFIGWFISFPLLILGAVIDLGFNSIAGEYIFYFTIPAGAIIWSIVGRNRPSFVLTQAISGGVVGVPLGMLTGLLLTGDGYALIFGGIIGFIIGGIALPVAIWRIKKTQTAISLWNVLRLAMFCA
jgi:hypothetical protein